MSANGEVRKRPDLWSYISFSSPSSRRPSDSLPTTSRNSTNDFEKPARYPGRPRGLTNPVDSYPMISSLPRLKLVKIGAAVLTIILLLALLGPSKTRSHIPGFAGHPPSSKVATPKCTEPYSPSKPLIQYALMIDAGSTGSRIHVYRFNNCGPTPDLESEIFKQTATKEGGSGLSSYDSDAEGAARSLDILLDEALIGVPEDYRSCTPVAVKATAGLRKLGEEKSNRILKAVRERIETKYPFPLVSDDHHGVEVMDGKDEGVYAWITTNFLLGKIGGPDNTPTAAIFDLGGGSTQIVFQPTFPRAVDGGMPETMAEGDHKYDLKFGGRNFSLYQHSYLGYGLMEARRSLHKLVVENAFKAAPAGNREWQKQPIANPCIAPGTTKEVAVELDATHALGTAVTVTMKGASSGSATQCRALAEKILKKESDCQITPCAFNGVHQPSLAKTFAREDIYLFSFFYDRMNPLGLPDSFTLGELRDTTRDVCEGVKGWNKFKAVSGALDELKDRPEYCLDLNFMLALLNHGYEMPMDREVKIAKKIKDNELGWCLGASLPLLNQESGWQCKVKEVS